MTMIAAESVVWKYTLGHEPLSLAWPEGSRCTGFRASLSTTGSAEFWLHRPLITEDVLSPVLVEIFGNGHTIPPGGEVLGTCPDGPYVWHLVKLAEQ